MEVRPLAESLTIPVAEDDYQIQEMQEEALTDAGFRPQIRSSAEEGATLLNSGLDELRTLVTDVNLKGKTSGWDLASCSGATGTAADEWARLGVPKNVLLTKPFAPAQLVAAVSQLLNMGSGPL